MSNRSNNSSFSLKKWFKSFNYSVNGIKLFFEIEYNSWIHTIAAIIVIAIGLSLGLNTYEWCLIAIAIGIVFIAEIINTAIEILTDMVSPGYSEQAKKVKDLASAGVLIASFVSIAIGLIIFTTKL